MGRCRSPVRGGVHRRVHHHREGFRTSTPAHGFSFAANGTRVAEQESTQLIWSVRPFASSGSLEGRRQEGHHLRPECRRTHVRHGGEPREVRELPAGCQVRVRLHTHARTHARTCHHHIITLSHLGDTLRSVLEINLAFTANRKCS